MTPVRARCRKNWRPSGLCRGQTWWNRRSPPAKRRRSDEQAMNSPFQGQFGELHVDGKRLEFYRLAPRDPAAPTIVMLHEGLGCMASWKDFPQALAEGTGCGVLVYSRYGHG